ncbi:MAG: hypothetical protein K0R54_4986 [Clostridiaceae bacterium]|jgi:hypothetical protein|nr:hypothetical protein [Clostridiaceae bacterium]
MLIEDEFTRLFNLNKTFDNNKKLYIPKAGEKVVRSLIDINKKESFILNMDRGRINLEKIKYQTRYKATNDIMLRLDVTRPRHRNPDGKIIEYPHIHIYKEGYGDKWAYPLNPKVFKDPNDLAQLLKDFLTYFNVKEIPDIVATYSLI